MNAKSFCTLIMSILAAASVVASATSEGDPDMIVSHIPREQVQSGGLITVGYSKRRQILEIEFTSGAVYRYLDVPSSVYRELQKAESKTGYYAANIKRNYRAVRVRPRVKDHPAN